MELLDTDSCRGTIPMDPPMSNSSMSHQDPDLDFDDTRIILQGASCTIAARSQRPTLHPQTALHMPSIALRDRAGADHESSSSARIHKGGGQHVAQQ
jgi:hypothetical protein